jgi:YD repeat-containing protein
MNRLLLFASSFTLFVQIGYAQPPADGPYGKTPYNFIPATPEAASFQRYGDLPVSYQRGLVDISIPLGSINLKSFSWPISLGYHAGGNKVGDVANSAGLGWTLNAYGIRSAKVIGRPGNQDPDRRFLNLYSVYNDGDAHDCEYYSEDDVNLAENVIGGGTDYLPDLEYINTPLFNLKAVGGMIYPATDIRDWSGNVTVDGTNYGTLSGFRDTKGNRYIFTDLGCYNASLSNTCYSPTGAVFNPNSLLFKVLTYEGDVLSFTYDTVSYGYNMPASQFRTSVMSSQCQRCNLEIGGESASCNNLYFAKEAFLNKIESSNGDVVRFYYSSRSDLPNGKKLDSIEFKRKINGTEELLKKFVLVQGYFGSGSADDLRLKLSELKLYDKNSVFINSHTFGYNSTNLPNRVSSKAHDWFGYYNGATSNTSLLPDEGSRTSSTTYAVASILEKITYPTGGTTTIEYERNPFGGLRVKTLKDYDSVSTVPKVRAFNYHMAEGNGSNPSLTFEDYLVTNFLATESNGTFDIQSDCNSIYLLACYAQRMNSSPVTNILSTYIENENYYPKVTEYMGSDSANGKIEYFFANTVGGTGNAYSPPVIQLTRKQVYKQNGGSYDLLTETWHNYFVGFADTSDMFGNPAIPLEGRVWVKDITKTRDEVSYACDFWLTKRWCKSFIDNSFCISSMPVLLANTVEKKYSYDPNLVIIDTTKYFYDGYITMQPTRVQKVTSKGDVITVTNTYPGFSIPGGVSLTQGEEDALDLLYDVNIRTSPFYSETTKNSTIIAKSLTTYQTTQSLALPKKAIEYPTGGSNFYEYKFNSYDSKANVLEFQGKDKIYQSMLYDSSSNTLAHCVGALNNEIAYSSFETGSAGNWSGISYGSIVNSVGITGNKYYQANFSISKSGLNSSATYIVSYWSQNSSYAVNSTSGAARGTYNGWTYYEHVITNPGSGIITLTGNGILDELRLYPKTAQMTTYTYEPLVGISAVCDANNRIQYYTYDSAGRLKTIMDQDKKILKAVDYKFHH